MKTTHSPARRLYVRNRYAFLKGITSPVKGNVSLDRSEVEAIEQWKYLNSLKRRVEKIKRETTFLNESKVSLFLLENSFLIPLIESAIPKVRDYFAKDNLSLNLLETEDYQPAGELVLSVLAEGEYELVSSAFDSFFDGWWIENISLAKGKLGVEIQFI